MLSAPHRVIFAGFESDTWKLQQAGWRLAAHEDFMRGTLNIALHHPDAGVEAMARELRYNFHGSPRGGEVLTFHVHHINSKIMIQTMPAFDFHDVDARPCFTTEPPRCMADLGIFARPLVRTEEILIEPSSVSECLDLIRRLQAPGLAEIRQRNSVREHVQGREQFHAQILSIAA